jgi:uncharacterized protein YdeI (YjbR/CyaY-like superfamily)
MAAGEHFARIEIESRAQLRAWLTLHHEQPNSVWLVTWKKASGDRHVPYGDIVDEVLCFGWIDSLPRKLDAERSMLLISPRKRGSAWSAVNKARLKRLAEDGLIHPSGQAAIDAAQADGSWSRLDAVDALEVPPDLAKALAARLGATENFARFPPSARRGILEWIVQARRPETRDKRVTETADLAQRNIRANQFRQPKA